MHVIEKDTLFTEITVEESATVRGGTDGVVSILGNQLVFQASFYYDAVIAANQNSGSPTNSSTVSNRLLPGLAFVSSNLIGI